MLMQPLEQRLPEHQCALTITHNDHKNCRETAEDWLENMDDWCDWETPDARQRAIDTDSIWTIQWYPKTPIGFICLAAPTLEELLAFVDNVKQQQEQN